MIDYLGLPRLRQMAVLHWTRTVHCFGEAETCPGEATTLAPLGW